MYNIVGTSIWPMNYSVDTIHMARIRLLSFVLQHQQVHIVKTSSTPQTNIIIVIAFLQGKIYKQKCV